MSIPVRMFSTLAVFLVFSHSILAQSGWSAGRASSPGDLIAVFFTSSDKGWIAGDDGYLAWTNDGGRTWTQQDIGVKANINEIYFRNDDNGYLVAGKRMFITKDGGTRWSEIQLYNPSELNGVVPEFLSIRFADKKLGFVVGSLLNADDEVVDSLVLRTNDGGETWSRVIVPFKKELFHLDFVSSSRGWIVGDKGMILATYDSGLNWEVQQSGTDRALYNVDFRDSKDGFAVGGKGTILRTEDGGRNWETVSTNFPTTFLRVDFADDKNGWVVGYDGSILRSSDRGKTWVRQESGSEENLYGLYMTKKYGWAVGAKGVLIQYRR